MKFFTGDIFGWLMILGVIGWVLDMAKPKPPKRNLAGLWIRVAKRFIK